MTTEPCDLSAVEARRLIGRKALSPVGTAGLPPRASRR